MAILTKLVRHNDLCICRYKKELIYFKLCGGVWVQHNPIGFSLVQTTEDYTPRIFYPSDFIESNDETVRLVKIARHGIYSAIE